MGTELLLIIVLLSIIGLIMAIYPRRVVAWTDRAENAILRRNTANATAGSGDASQGNAKLTSIIELSTRVVGIFTFALGVFYIVLFYFVYPV